MSVRISVILPLTEERGLTEEAVSGWVNQTLPPARTELVVVAGNEVVPSRALTKLLRSHDRVVTGRFANLAAFYDAGVRVASGELVFLTESHCLPAPDCLEATDRFLARNPHLAGAATNSRPACENAYARIDADTFYEGFREHIRPGDWRKMNVHGYAMKRAVFLALGGYRHEYGRFAEMLMAASLRDGGYELGYAEEAVITHHYRGSLGELIVGIDDYVRGESLYRADHPGSDRVGHTYLPEVSNPRSPRAAALEREVAAALLGRVFGHKIAVVSQGLRVAGQVATRLLGRRGPVAAAWLGVLAARIRCWWNRHDAARLDTPYRELFHRAAALSRLRALASLPLAEADSPRPARVLGIEDLPDWALYGFHGIERWKGEALRWSSPLAAVRLPLVPGAYRLTLVTHGIRTCHHPANLRVALNGVRIEARQLPNGDYELPIEARLCRPREQTLIWVCDPLRPREHGSRDHRDLGLSLFAVQVEPVGTVGLRRAA
jgi:hypothetical protein